MATGNSEITSKALEAARSGNEDKSELPPPYTHEQQAYNYDQYVAGKTAPNAPVGYYQPHSGYVAYPQTAAGYSSLPVTPGAASNEMLIPGAPQYFVIQRERESFVKQLILSCFVFWLCCWPLGLTAFILAMMANSRSTSPDELSTAEAHRLGVHSWRTSIAGLIIGAILLTIIIIVQVTYA